MDVYHELHGTTFVWDARKARANELKHDGVTFERAITTFSIRCCGSWMLAGQMRSARL
jgi:hypothetical protein